MVLANDMVPTNTADYSAYILKIRCAQAGLRLPQPRRRGPDHLPQAVQGVQPALPARRRRHGHRAVLGRRPGQPVGPLAEPVVPRPERSRRRRRSRKRFSEKFGRPPDNQAWGDYVGVKHRAAERSPRPSAPTPQTLIQHLEKGATFDILKERKGSFRAWDHQLLQEMYVVRGEGQGEDRRTSGTSSTSSSTVPGPKESLELIQPTEAGESVQDGVSGRG